MNATLVTALWPQTRRSPLYPVLLAVFGSLLLTLSAKLQLPFWPVPQTLQTFVVLVLGFVYGWKLAGATVLLYLLEGLAGLPVFSGTPEKGLGLAYMTGPTGGYLLGFLPAALLCGWFAERGWDRSAARTALAMLLGNALIYIPGLLWLGALLGWDKPILSFGLYPFLLGDLAKLAMAAALLPLLWKLLGRHP